MEKLSLPLKTVTPGHLHLCLLRDGSVVSWEGRGLLTWLGKAPRSAGLGVRERGLKAKFSRVQ